VNNGGEMVGHVIRTVDSTVAFKALHASHGKAARAEPVAALYEQGRAHHVGIFPDLEDQLCGWVAGDKSPDRLDALVWAGTELMLSSSYGEIPMASAGASWGSGLGNSNPLVDSILQQLARVRDEQQRQGEAARAAGQHGGEPELSEAQREHAAGLARMLGRLDLWSGPRW
jgi:hypothetical protein